MHHTLLGLALSVALVACSSGGGTASECAALSDALCGETDAIIVDAAWLDARLDDSDVQVVDTRPTGYDASRIPGAIHLLPGDLASTVDGIAAQIAPVEQAQAALRAAGLQNDVTVVVYGAPPEYDPSRVVWALSYYQHGDVRYLDGGFAGWVDAGGALDSGPTQSTPSEYTIVGVDDSLRVTGDWVLTALGDEPYDMPQIQLVDARSEGEFEAGRIPSARSINWTRNREGGFLLPEADLLQLYDGFDPAQTTVTYCVTGWRGSFAWLTLTALGYEDVRLYDGSWTEWGPGDFPVEP